jgi:hypothetical protein
MFRGMPGFEVRTTRSCDLYAADAKREVTKRRRGRGARAWVEL